MKKSLEHTRAVGTWVGTGIFSQRAVLLQLVWGTGLMDRIGCRHNKAISNFLFTFAYTSWTITWLVNNPIQNLLVFLCTVSCFYNNKTIRYSSCFFCMHYLQFCVYFFALGYFLCGFLTIFLTFWSLMMIVTLSWSGYDMSPFIRKYAKYLGEKSVSYRTVAFDFCKVKRG